MLRQSPGAQVSVNDPFGWPLNHTQPPFNNPKLRRALLPAIDQKTFLASVIGGQTDLGRAPSGYFIESQQMSSHAGLDVLSGPRDDAIAAIVWSAAISVLDGCAAGAGTRLRRREGRDAGADLSAGLHADDAGRARRVRPAWPERGFPVHGLGFGGDPAHQPRTGGPRRLELLHHANRGLAACAPGGSFELRGNGAKGWFCWPGDEELERLRTAWFDAPDLAAQKAIAAQVRVRALETLPCIQLGNCSSRRRFGRISGKL